MKERIEDLGKLAILLRQLGEHDLFDFWRGRTKDFADYVMEQMEKDKGEKACIYDLLDGMARGIKHVEELIGDCFYIAEGLDYDNHPNNKQ